MPGWPEARVRIHGARARCGEAMTRPHRLRCEYFTNPLCIDTPRPRLSWQTSDDRRGARQTAYQVMVDDGLWDSGKVATDQSVHVEYAGAPLKSRQHCPWRVRTWTSASSVEPDMNGEASEWSEPAFWEMGLLERSDWKAQWIGAAIV